MKQLAAHILICLLAVSLPACKDLFDPEIEMMTPAIVVDGLVTDELMNHQVRIFYSQEYSQWYEPVPLTNAAVFVSDNAGNRFQYKEITPGVYQAIDPFSGQVGNSYVLHFKTNSGKLFESFPQQIRPMVQLDSIFGAFGVMEWLEENSHGYHYMNRFHGLDVLVNIGKDGSCIPRVRFEPRILQLFHTSDFLGETTFFWRKYSNNQGDFVNFPGIETGMAGLHNHNLSFVPFNKRFYRLGEDTHMNGRYLLIRMFRLNPESYAFYKGVSKQISADGQLFDPIDAQLPTNIQCLSHPEKKVLGFFEASSAVGLTFSVYALEFTNTIAIEPYSDLNYLPRSGYSVGEMPYFWRWY
jgi:hypothetical protein